MTTGHELSWFGSWSRPLQRALVALLVSSTLMVTAPVEAAGPTTGPRPTVPHRNPGQIGTRLVEPGVGIRSETGKTRVEVMVIYANKSGNVDPRARGIQRQLTNLMGFTGSEVLSTHTDQLGPNQSTTIPVAGGRKLEITMVSFDAQQARVRLEMFLGSEKKWDTTTLIRRDGQPFIAGGPPHQQGKLIFTVDVPN